MWKQAARSILNVSLGLVLLGACEKKDEAPPSGKQAAEVGAAQTEHAKAVADKAKADTAVETAKAKQDEAAERVDATKDKAKDTASNVADSNKDKDNGWKGPDKGWAHDWATFAAGTDATFDKGDYTIERDKSGTLTAYRKTQPVAGSSYVDMKDSTLAAQVKQRLAADSDDSVKAVTVDARDHVVTLSGTVKDTDAAGNAVRIALGTPGADKVVSRMTWASK